MFKKLLKESHGLIWTVAGTAMVLITLSGDTLNSAIWISAIALAGHFVGVIFSKEDNNE
jgi:hypothetical protein